MQSKARQFLLLLPLLIAGCSTEVEVSVETRTPYETREHVEKFETKVGVAVLTQQEDPDPASVPDDKPVPEQPPTPPEPEEKTVEVSGTANLAMVVEGDLHVHEHFHEHLHLEAPPRSGPKRIEEMPEPVAVEIRRPKLDPECQRLLREHQERVRQWKAMMGR